MRVHNNFGGLKNGMYVNIIKEGYDWKLIKHRGRPLYIPSWVFERDNNTSFREFESSLLDREEDF